VFVATNFAAKSGFGYLNAIYYRITSRRPRAQYFAIAVSEQAGRSLDLAPPAAALRDGVRRHDRACEARAQRRGRHL